jgi:hypothetical protein
MFDHRYIQRGLVLYHSLMRHSPQSVLHVLCLSEKCREQLEALHLPGLQPVSLAELEENDPALRAAKADGRSTVEYYFTLSPCLPLFLLRRHQMDVLAYVDADAAFYGAPESVLPSMQGYSVGIVGHRFAARLKHLEKYGRFNVGFQVFRNDANGIECLEWWRARCLEWCHDRLEGDRFADQKYLDCWPERFHALELPQKGLNVAPWNLERYTFTEEGGRILVDGEPLLYYHFHGLKPFHGSYWLSGTADYGIRLPHFLLEKLYRPYIRQLRSIPLAAEAPCKRGGVGPLRQGLRKLKWYASVLLHWRTFVILE